MAPVENIETAIGNTSGRGSAAKRSASFSGGQILDSNSGADHSDMMRFLWE